MDFIDLPPWAQTVLAVLGLLSLALPIVGRVVAPSRPELGARLIAAGNDIGSAIGRKPPEPPGTWDDTTPVGPRKPEVER